MMPGRLRILFLLLPSGVILLSLVYIIALLGARALFAVPVHESEPRALLGVILYPGHGLRELPHIALLAFFWVGSLRPAEGLRKASEQAARILLLVALAGAFLFVWSGLESGWSSSWADLSQRRASATLEGPGVHFRYHLMSDIVLALLFIAAGRFLSSPASCESTGRWHYLFGTLLLLAMIALWGVSGTTTPRFLGHQLREIVTHAWLTLPVLCAVAACGEAPISLRRGLSRGAWMPFAAFLVCAGVLFVAVVRTDILRYSSAPDRSVALNLAVHNFEHLIDVVVLALIMLFSRGDAKQDAGSKR